MRAPSHDGSPRSGRPGRDRRTSPIRVTCHGPPESLACGHERRPGHVHAGRVRAGHPLVQHRGRPPDAAAPAAAPGHARAGRAGRPGAALPDRADHAGGQRGAVRRDPGAGARRLQAVPPEPALPRPPLGAEARHAGPDLLQVRGRLAGRLAQDQHRDPAGLLQLAARRTPADDRDRRRPVGHRALLRLRALRRRVRGVAGRGVVRHEAAAAHPDRGLRRHRAPLAEPADRVGQGVRRGPPRLAGHRDLRGGRGGGAGRDHQVRPRVGAQPRAAAPDGDRRGGAAPARQGRRDQRRPRRRLRRRRLQLRRAGVPVPAREARRQPGPDGSSPSSRARARR